MKDRYYTVEHLCQAHRTPPRCRALTGVDYPVITKTETRFHAKEYGDKTLSLAIEKAKQNHTNVFDNNGNDIWNWDDWIISLASSPKHKLA